MAKKMCVAYFPFLQLADHLKIMFLHVITGAQVQKGGGRRGQMRCTSSDTAKKSQFLHFLMFHLLPILDFFKCPVTYSPPSRMVAGV